MGEPVAYFIVGIKILQEHQEFLNQLVGRHFNLETETKKYSFGDFKLERIAGSYFLSCFTASYSDQINEIVEPTNLKDFQNWLNQNGFSDRKGFSEQVSRYLVRD